MTEAEARLLVLAVAIGMLLLVAWRRGALGGAARQRAGAAAFADRVGLPGVTPVLARRVTRRQRFVLTGVVAGLAGTAVMDATAVADAWIAPVYAGLALGAVADAVTRSGPPPGTPRVAHSASTRLRDYVPAWLLGAAVVAAGCAPVLALLWAVAPRTERDLATIEVSGAAVTWVVLAAAGGLAASLALARLVVRRPQSAGTPEDLAVDDALRSQAVRDVLHVTAAMSFVVAWTLAFSLTDQDVDGVVRRAGGSFPLVLLVAIFLVGLAHELTGGPRHWRARLHPELERVGVSSR